MSQLDDIIAGLDIPEAREVTWLSDQGISDEALIEPWPVLAATVRFHKSTRTFAFGADANDGQRALIFQSLSEGHLIDLIAWQPKSQRMASLAGTGFCIGDDALCSDPTTWFAGATLNVYGSPLAWLAAERDGIVIVDPERVWLFLGNAPNVTANTPQLAKALRKWIQPPPPPCLIRVAKERPCNRGSAT